ncbi:VOC family protein [Lacticaseibacillus sp. GG6-2]
MLPSLHHVSLLTGDIPATTAFYRDRLGLRLVKNTVNQENLHMRHIFYGDATGTPGTVITFFGVDHLGPRYDDGSHMAGITFGIPEAKTEYWKNRLGGLTVQDPNGVTITLTPVASQDQHDLLGYWGSALNVVDVEATRRFFAAMLGVDSTTREILLPDSRRLALQQVAPGKHRFGRGSIDHIALTVASVDVLADLQQQARAHGYVIEKLIDRGWFTSLYVREPNGNRIEFATPTPGFTLDEPQATLGQGLGLPPHLEPQRSAIAAYWHRKGVDFND